MSSNSLSVYGSREEVRELAERFRRMLPGGAKMSEGDALALAQIGLAHDLDAFNKEIWLIFNEDTGKSYGIMVGIAGWRKHAQRISPYWGVGGTNGFHRITEPDKLAFYGLKPDTAAIVYEYRFADEKSIEAWSRAVDTIMKATKCSLEQAQKMAGPMPINIGVGIFEPGERSKMKGFQAAMYRAERDALRRRYTIKFIGALPEVAGSEDDEPEVYDTQAQEVEAAAEAQAESKAEKRDAEQILSELGYDRA